MNDGPAQRSLIDPARPVPTMATGGCAAALMSADRLPAFAEAVVAQALRLPGCREAVLLWSQDWPQERRSHPAVPLSAQRLALAEQARSSNGAVSADGRDVAVLLGADDAGMAAVLVCRFADEAEAAGCGEWSMLVQLARLRLRNLMGSERLRQSVARLEQAERLQRALFAIADMAGSEMEMPEMLRAVHRTVAGLMYAENFYIVLYDAERDAIRFMYYVDSVDPEPRDGELAMGDIERGLTWYLVRDRKALMGSTAELRRQVSGELALHGPDSFDWLGVPMLRGTEVRGAVVVQSYQADVRFSAGDQALLSFVASHILTALERKQGQAELERRVRERTHELAEANRVLSVEIVERQRAENLQAALFRIAELSSADGGITEFCAEIHRIVGGLIDATNFYIALLSDDRAHLEFPYYVDATVPRTPPRRPLGRGSSEFVMRSGRPLLATPEEVAELNAGGEIQVYGAPPRYYLGVPLPGPEGAIGVVAVQSYSDTVNYTRRDQELLTFVSYHIANALLRRRSAQTLRDANQLLEQRVEERTRELREQIAVRERIEQRLKHEVLHDSLTGLPNRGYLRDRLERVIARHRRDPSRAFAVLYMDVDRFKIINDSLGHLVGDEVLREVARRLAGCLREPDVVARLGGDEFAILLEDVDGVDAPVTVARRVIRALGAPMQVGGKELATSASVGIVLSDARHASADDALRDADVAMYRAKQKGRHRLELFDEGLHREALDVLETEGDLRRALAGDEFVPYYQPIVRLTDAHIVGFEALVRWNHPQRGMLAPAAFLKIAEDHGHLEAIDWLLYRRAFANTAALCGVDPDAFVSINVAGRHLLRSDFDQRLLGLIGEAGIEPAQVRIELTEGSLIDGSQQTRGILERLAAAGVDTSLDDFGTGFSSLSYLHRFPLRMLKIDRSFVTELGEGDGAGAAVVRSVIGLARALGMEVVAEGIETVAQREALLAMGCELGQGYLFARPQPATHWLGEQAAATAEA